MDKDGLSSIALICLLLVIILVAYYVRRNHVLDLRQLTLGEQVAGVVTATPKPEEKEEKKVTPVEGQDLMMTLASGVENAFQTDLVAGNLTTVTYINDQLWWRSDNEGYRILVTPAKTFGVQIPTKVRASDFTPSKAGENHPALADTLVAGVIKELNQQFNNLGYKKGSFKNCPISEANDPFNNCVATYTKGADKCSLIVGFGRLDRQLEIQAYFRLEVACAETYAVAYQKAQPYLFILEIANPAWRVPDMAVYEVKTVGTFSYVNFGSNYGIFQKNEKGQRLLAGGTTPPPCALVTQEQIPAEIYQNCY
jgi:hypothetical protein